MIEVVCDGGVIEGVGVFFFFNDTATTEIYTLSLHDALPISRGEISDLAILYLLLYHGL